jgi:hypothetical protein
MWVVLNDGDEHDYGIPDVYGPFPDEHTAALFAVSRFPDDEFDDASTAFVVEVFADVQ